MRGRISPGLLAAWGPHAQRPSPSVFVRRHALPALVSREYTSKQTASRPIVKEGGDVDSRVLLDAHTHTRVATAQRLVRELSGRVDSPEAVQRELLAVIASFGPSEVTAAPADAIELLLTLRELPEGFALPGVSNICDAFIAGGCRGLTPPLAHELLEAACEARPPLTKLVCAVMAAQTACLPAVAATTPTSDGGASSLRSSSRRLPSKDGSNQVQPHGVENLRQMRRGKRQQPSRVSGASRADQIDAQQQTVPILLASAPVPSMAPTASAPPSQETLASDMPSVVRRVPEDLSPREWSALLRPLAEFGLHCAGSVSNIQMSRTGASGSTGMDGTGSAGDASLCASLAAEAMWRTACLAGLARPVTPSGSEPFRARFVAVGFRDEAAEDVAGSSPSVAWASITGATPSQAFRSSLIAALRGSPVHTVSITDVARSLHRFMMLKPPAGLPRPPPTVCQHLLVELTHALPRPPSTLKLTLQLAPMLSQLPEALLSRIPRHYFDLLRKALSMKKLPTIDPAVRVHAAYLLLSMGSHDNGNTEAAESLISALTPAEIISLSRPLVEAKTGNGAAAAESYLTWGPDHSAVPLLATMLDSLRFNGDYRRASDRALLHSIFTALLSFDLSHVKDLLHLLTVLRLCAQLVDRLPISPDTVADVDAHVTGRGASQSALSPFDVTLSTLSDTAFSALHRIASAVNEFANPDSLGRLRVSHMFGVVAPLGRAAMGAAMGMASSSDTCLAAAIHQPVAQEFAQHFLRCSEDLGKDEARNGDVGAREGEVVDAPSISLILLQEDDFLGQGDPTLRNRSFPLLLLKAQRHAKILPFAPSLTFPALADLCGELHSRVSRMATVAHPSQRDIENAVEVACVTAWFSSHLNRSTGSAPEQRELAAGVALQAQSVLAHMLSIYVPAIAASASAFSQLVQETAGQGTPRASTDSNAAARSYSKNLRECQNLTATLHHSLRAVSLCGHDDSHGGTERTMSQPSVSNVAAACRTLLVALCQRLLGAQVMLMSQRASASNSPTSVDATLIKSLFGTQAALQRFQSLPALWRRVSGNPTVMNAPTGEVTQTTSRGQRLTPSSESDADAQLAAAAVKHLTRLASAATTTLAWDHVDAGH